MTAWTDSALCLRTTLRSVSYCTASNGGRLRGLMLRNRPFEIGAYIPGSVIWRS